MKTANISFVVLLFEIKSLFVVLVILQLPLQTRLDSNSQRCTYICLPLPTSMLGLKVHATASWQGAYSLASENKLRLKTLDGINCYLLPLCTYKKRKMPASQRMSPKYHGVLSCKWGIYSTRLSARLSDHCERGGRTIVSQSGG